MTSLDSVPTHNLTCALAAAGVKPGRFHRHFYGGALGNALAEAGEISRHITDPMRGTGAGKGGGRLFSTQGVIFLGVFFRLISGGINSVQAIRIAQVFLFMGEVGDGLRAFGRGQPRPASRLFPGEDDTFLVAIIDNSSLKVSDNFAFVPKQMLTADHLVAWLGGLGADGSSVCIVNLSDVCRVIKSSLAASANKADLDEKARELEDATMLEVEALDAFLADCTIRDYRARTPVREFFRACAAPQLWTAGSWIFPALALLPNFGPPEAGFFRLFHDDGLVTPSG